MGTFDDILDLERQVWSALVAGDAEADGRLLADDFLGVYGTGFAAKAEHTGQLAEAPTVGHYELSDARLVELSSEVVLLAYRATCVRRSADGAAAPESMYVSSIWQRRDGSWCNVFSQDTPSAG